MGSIDMTKPMSAALSSAVNKSPQQQESNSWERRELNPGLLGEKHLIAMQSLGPKLPVIKNSY